MSGSPGEELEEKFWRKYTVMLPYPRRDSEEPESTPVEEGEPSVYNFEDDDQDLSASQRSDIQEQSSASYGERSPIELYVDLGEKMEGVLGKIGAEITHAINMKRLKMETDIKKSFEGIDEKMKQTWNSYESEISKLNEDSTQSFINLFEQWNSDFQNLQEQQKKLMDDFQKEVMTLQQYRLIQNQRMRTVKQVHEQFLKNLEELEKENHKMLLSIQNDFQEEMNKF
ncbi:hypothetical protein STEG23_025235 [Scotinomys teguina]